jgi:hypothetical protein
MLEAASPQEQAWLAVQVVTQQTMQFIKAGKPGSMQLFGGSEHGAKPTPPDNGTSAQRSNQLP